MKKKQRKEALVSYAWSAPSLLLIGLMVIFPILYTFYISLTNMNVYHWFDFTVIGLDNYVRALFVFPVGFAGNDSLDGREYGAPAGDCLYSGKLAEREEAAFAGAIQDHPHVPLGNAGVCGYPPLEDRYVQYAIRPVEPVDE